MKANVDINFNANYTMKLLDAASGSVKKQAEFHNIPVVGFRSCLCSMALTDDDGEVGAYPAYNQLLNTLRLGSGTAEPSHSDTALSSQLWDIRNTSIDFSWIDDYTGRATASFTVPATAEYVGTVREVGLACRRTDSSRTTNNAILCTRALITDSEGQPIEFEKTDLDILIVTVVVDMSLRSSTAAFEIFKNNIFVRNILTGMYTSYRGFTNEYGFPNLCRFHTDMDYYHNKATTGDTIEKSVGSGTTAIRGWNASVPAFVQYPVTRLLATDITDERYYKAIAIPGIGYWKLPNEDVMPTYTISGISVGTGDGVTTQFTNPLSYFKEGTDVVYKNGVALTRDVDYTIHHVGNVNCLPEVTERVYGAPKVSSSASVNVNTSASLRPMFTPTAYYGTWELLTRYFGSGNVCYCLSSTYPLYIEYPEAVTMNCVKCTGMLYRISSSGSTYNITSVITFYIDYSEDGTEYTELGSVSATSGSGPFTIDFADTTAKYWRLRVSGVSEPVVLYGTNADSYFTLSRKQPYITFAQAPAEGDVITMDVGMDVVMKNSNFVVDLGAMLVFNF